MVVGGGGGDELYGWERGEGGDEYGCTSCGNVDRVVSAVFLLLARGVGEAKSGEKEYSMLWERLPEGTAFYSGCVGGEGGAVRCGGVMLLRGRLVTIGELKSWYAVDGDGSELDLRMRECGLNSRLEDMLQGWHCYWEGEGDVYGERVALEYGDAEMESMLALEDLCGRSRCGEAMRSRFMLRIKELQGTSLVSLSHRTHLIQLESPDYGLTCHYSPHKASSLPTGYFQSFTAGNLSEDHVLSPVVEFTSSLAAFSTPQGIAGTTVFDDDWPNWNYGTQNEGFCTESRDIFGTELCQVGSNSFDNVIFDDNSGPLLESGQSWGFDSGNILEFDPSPFTDGINNFGDGFARTCPGLAFHDGTVSYPAQTAQETATQTDGTSQHMMQSVFPQSSGISPLGNTVAYTAANNTLPLPAAAFTSALAPSPAHDPTTGRILCPYCMVTFRYSRDQIRHAATAHGIKRGLHRCNVVGCPKSQGTGYSRADKLTEHMWKKHGDLGYRKVGK